MTNEIGNILDLTLIILEESVLQMRAKAKNFANVEKRQDIWHN